jgi:capsular exopolysaccharide synthesis family protein
MDNVKNASYADLTSFNLFDLRDTSRTAEPPDDTCTLDVLDDRRLIVHPGADPVFVEQYRRLGAALHHAQGQEGTHSVMVASAVAAEGKTLTAVNLALVLSRSFAKRVLLVDGDLRKPSVHLLLGVGNGIGLRELLERPKRRLPAHTLSPTLSVITGGDADCDPVALLASDAAAQFLAETREQFDWVIVDTPPVVLFPDAELFASKIDTCVMVVRAGTTGTDVAAWAASTLGASRILGVVLNRAEPPEIAGGYGRYGYPESGRIPGHLS